MTHDELVKRAGRWLRKSMGCSVVLTELTAFTSTGEKPDALGFRGEGKSILIECKTSRADFRADAKKSFRINPEAGMGDFRFYMCEPGLLDTEDMPRGWGLLQVVKKRIVRLTGPNPKYGVNYFTGHKRNEIVMCMSALRRVGSKAVAEACRPQHDRSM